MTNLDSEDFRAAIGAIVAPGQTTGTNVRALFKTVWEDFAAALSAHAGIAAAILPSDDGRRWHLALWPRFRPAWRHLMLSYSLDASSTTILGHGSTRLDSVEALRAWLKEFAASPSFQESLAVLREQENEPVPAMLKDANGESCTVEVSPEHQKQLHEASSPSLDASVELMEGETLPSGQLSRFISAGLEFSVTRSSVSGRQVLLSLSRVY